MGIQRGEAAREKGPIGHAKATALDQVCDSYILIGSDWHSCRGCGKKRFAEGFLHGVAEYSARYHPAALPARGG